MKISGASTASPTGLKKIQKYEFIDAIRGIAFLTVFVSHASISLGKLGCPEGLVRLGLQGGIGVQLFFIASALTLMLSLDARQDSERSSLRNFFLRRFFRIAPLFYSAILFYGVVFGANGDSRVPQTMTIGSYLSTLTFTNGWSPHWINQVVPGGWSISVEMTFYLMVPFLHSRLKGRWQAILAMILIYGAVSALSEATLSWLEHRGQSDVSGMNQAFVHYWLPYQLYRFFAGFTLYFLIRDGIKVHPDPVLARSNLINSLGLLGISLLILGLSISGRLPRFASSFTCTVALVFLGWSLSVSPLRLFVNPATRWIGRLSFSAYVSHFAAIYVTDQLFHVAVPTLGKLPWTIGVSAFFLIALAITLAVSELLYQLIEKPGQSLGRLLIARLDASGVRSIDRDLVASTQLSIDESISIR